MEGMEGRRDNEMVRISLFRQKQNNKAKHQQQARTHQTRHTCFHQPITSSGYSYHHRFQKYYEHDETLAIAVARSLPLRSGVGREQNRSPALAGFLHTSSSFLYSYYFMPTCSPFHITDIARLLLSRWASRVRPPTPHTQRGGRSRGAAVCHGRSYTPLAPTTVRTCPSTHTLTSPSAPHTYTGHS